MPRKEHTILKSKYSLRGDDVAEEEDHVKKPKQKPEGKSKTIKTEQAGEAGEPDDSVIGEAIDEGAQDAADDIVEEVLEERKLHKSEISVRLSWLGKTADGDAYTYLKATCTDLGVTSIRAIITFKHLQFVDLSNNLLTLDALQPVTELPFLTLIQANKNKLKSAALNKCKYLQVIVMNNNTIFDVEDVFQPEMSTIEVAYNFIKEIKFKNRMTHLRVLDFRYNFLTDISNMDFPNLDSLYIAGNKIKDLTGIATLLNLRVLHARGNPIRFLSGFETPLPKLRYLNLRNTRIGTLRQIRKLKDQPALDTLVLAGTIYMGGEGKEDGEAPAATEDDPELRVEVLATLPRLKRFNKTVYTPDERQEAKDLQTQWLEEGEKEEDEELDEEPEENEEDDADDV